MSELPTSKQVTRYTQPCIQIQHSPEFTTAEVPLFEDPKGKWVCYDDIKHLLKSPADTSRDAGAVFESAKAAADAFLKEDQQENGAMPINLKIAIQTFARWLDKRGSSGEPTRDAGDAAKWRGLLDWFGLDARDVDTPGSEEELQHLVRRIEIICATTGRDPNCYLAERSDEELAPVETAGESVDEEIGAAVRVVSQNCDLSDLKRRGEWLRDVLASHNLHIVRRAVNGSARWVDGGSLNNGRCSFMYRNFNGPCCRLPAGHDGEHETDSALLTRPAKP